MRMSKNKRRKQQRALFRQLENRLAHAPECTEAKKALRELREIHFRDVDAEIDGLDLQGEQRFTRRILRSIDRDIEGGEWITFRASDGRFLQIKAGIGDYIRARAEPASETAAPADRMRAIAAQHMFERAIHRLQAPGRARTGQ